MKKFDIHCFCVVRVKYCGVEADTRELALKIIEEKAMADLHQTFCNENLLNNPEGATDVEFAEEFSHFLVDTRGTETYEDSEWFNADLTPFEPLELEAQHGKA